MSGCVRLVLHQIGFVLGKRFGSSRPWSARHHVIKLPLELGEFILLGLRFILNLLRILFADGPSNHWILLERIQALGEVIEFGRWADTDVLALGLDVSPARWSFQVPRRALSKFVWRMVLVFPASLGQLGESCR